MTYDPACADLARHFLSEEKLDTDQNVDELAKRIQSVIEDYLEFDDDLREQRIALRRKSA